jgi:putative aminopeptidase FrvX
VYRRTMILQLASVILGLAASTTAQSNIPYNRVFEIPAVSGYEQDLAAEIRSQLKEYSPKTDNLGNLYVTLGSGVPHRLIVTPMDEPGYVVSGITPDGFLRVQRLPQASPTPVFDLLHAAQPVVVMTRKGKRVLGVFAGLSVHLEPARQNVPKMTHPDEMYVDIGATSAEEVRAAGVDLLDPVALNRKYRSIGNSGLAGPAVGDRFGCAVLIELLSRARQSKIAGTTTVAFVTQQWTGGRGLDRLLNELRSDELIYVGRLAPPRSADGKTAPKQLNFDQAGILLALDDASKSPIGFAAELADLAAKSNLTITPVVAARPRLSGYAKTSALPERFTQLGIPVRWPVTPAEFVAYKDLRNLGDLLEAYLQIPTTPNGVGSASGIGGGGHTFPLKNLVEAYGASGYEEKVREQVKVWLPRGAKTDTDSAGNLILHLGDAKPDAKTPRIVFVAHMDEIGYQVRSIEPDGRLLVDVLGGGYTEYFQGHVVLVHTDEYPVGGVLELPTGWDQSGFEWPHGPRSMDEAVHVYVGTHSAEETHKLGVRVGDWLTIPKEYRPLLGTRANGRSFDDRVGCAALIEAVNALGPDLPGRDVTFVWSTEEEVGLKGAAAYAERAARDGKTPDFVFAIDTFVSSDSPLESKRFADAKIGKGFVIRAVDNSNITPREYVDRVVKLARENNIPVQYGVTGGGNDGAVFTRYGSVDIPLGWPLRYSHSPGEVIDTRDLDALAKIVAVLAKSW